MVYSKKGVLCVVLFGVGGVCVCVCVCYDVMYNELFFICYVVMFNL